VKKARLASLACAPVAAVGVTACGSSSKKSDTARGGTAASSTTASSASNGGAPAGSAKGAPFVLGVICSCSGPQAAVLGGSSKVMTAWANATNAAGGINGHPVKMVIKDDGATPSQSLQDAKSLVEQSHVIGMVDESLADAAFADYVIQKGVPIVGGASPEAVFGTNPDWFPAGSPLIPLVVGTIAEAKGKSTLGAMYCAESPICAQIIPLTQGIGKIFGIKVVPQKISGTAPNYTAPCLTVKSAGDDALYIADNGPIVQRVLASCTQPGYKPTNVGPATTTTNQMLQDPPVAGSLFSGTNANPYDASLPAVKAFQDALEQSYPGFLKGDTFAYGEYFPWLAGKLFQAAAKAGNLTPTSTSADLKRGLYALKGETLEGLAPPLNYTPASRTSPRAGSATRPSLGPWRRRMEISSCV
jgi:branched-chain amino acid transport system substrate-binding protein